MISIDKDGVKTVTGKRHRLVSADKLGLICLIDGTARSKTWTKQDVEEFATENAAIERVKEKGWEVPEHLEETEIEVLR